MKCKYCNESFEKKGLKVFCSRKCNVDYWHKVEADKINTCPIAKEKKRLKSLLWYRNKKGLSLSHELLIAKKGSGYTKDGYKIIYLKKHPNADKRGYILEHVYIMSNHLDRPLKKGETVHHLNGIRNDNRIENLELWTTRQCKGQRVEDKVLWAKEFLQQYGYDVIKKENSNKPKIG